MLTALDPSTVLPGKTMSEALVACRIECLLHVFTHVSHVAFHTCKHTRLSVCSLIDATKPEAVFETLGENFQGPLIALELRPLEWQYGVKPKAHAKKKGQSAKRKAKH